VETEDEFVDGSRDRATPAHYRVSIRYIAPGLAAHTCRLHDAIIMLSLDLDNLHRQVGYLPPKSFRLT
jgi:hypothetical protein